jgi:hypothetical protein
MISEGTAEYSMLQQVERAVNTVFSRAELRIPISMKQHSDSFKVEHSIMSTALWAQYYEHNIMSAAL